MPTLSTVCPKCKGKRIFHIGDIIAFSGDKSYFSLAGLVDSAKIAGLRVHGAKDDVVAVISKAANGSSKSIENAKKRGILILRPDEFRDELKKICEGNVPNKKNPQISRLITSDARVFAWGLSPDQEIILAAFCKKNQVSRWKIRKPSLTFSITTSLHLKSGNAKVLRSMGVPVYDFNKIIKTLKP
jgi:hypothetical protein